MLADLPAGVSRLTGPDLDVVLPVIDRLARPGPGQAGTRSPPTPNPAGRSPPHRPEPPPSGSQSGARPWTAGTRAWWLRRSANWPAPELRTAAEAVAAGRLSVPAGCVVAAEWRQLEPLIEPDAGEAVLAGLVAMGVVDGSAGVRRLRPALLARYGLGEVLQEVEDRHAGRR